MDFFMNRSINSRAKLEYTYNFFLNMYMGTAMGAGDHLPEYICKGAGPL